MAKKYIVVEAGWDIKADPFVWVDGPFNNYEDAKNDFDAKLMMQLGIVGIYIGKVFEQVKGRPLYVVMDEVNIEK